MDRKFYLVILTAFHEEHLVGFPTVGPAMRAVSAPFVRDKNVTATAAFVEPNQSVSLGIWNAY